MSSFVVGDRYKIEWTDYDASNRMVPIQLTTASDGEINFWKDTTGLIVEMEEEGDEASGLYMAHFEDYPEWEGVKLSYHFEFDSPSYNLTRVTEKTNHAFACTCRTPYGCTCGAFAAEMLAKNRVYNKWTKTWQEKKCV